MMRRHEGAKGGSEMKQGRLKDRVAIITGAARGIGKATAFKMGDEGASVVLVDISSEGLTRITDELNAAGAKALGAAVDIRDRNAVHKIVERANRNFGTVDILVNNAGVVCTGLLEEAKEEEWDTVAGVNLKGTFFCTQAVVPIMKKNRYGKIVNIGSRVSLGKESRTVYAATKAGLIGMTRTWALELAQYNINVNYIGPGMIATEMFKKANPENSEKTVKLVNSIPLKRMGNPEEVANLISFLASDEASFITGQTIFICGGMTVGAAQY
jgi:NAD(P)-dependent dehydrogenase (short-subunit alcohol dehydrogenase family)